MSDCVILCVKEASFK